MELWKATAPWVDHNTMLIFRLVSTDYQKKQNIQHKTKVNILEGFQNVKD